MPTKVSESLYRDIIELIAQLSLDTDREKRSLRDKIDLGERGEKWKTEIDVGGSRREFCIHLVSKLNGFGMINGRDHALTRLLEAVEEDFGAGEPAVRNLIRRISEEVYESTLVDKIVAHAQRGQLAPVCRALHIHPSALADGDPEDRARQLIQIVKDKNRLSDLAQVLDSEPTDEESQNFPFTNRDEEFDKVLHTSGSPYVFLHAPAGYGKTHFLTELRDRYEELRWVAGYVLLRKNWSLAEVVWQLAFDLSKVELHVQEENARQLGALLGEEVARRWAAEPTLTGLALLIDVEPGTPEELVREITQEFIPGMHGTLLQLVPATFDQPRRFRVTLSARHIYHKAIKSVPKFLPVGLTPFTYDVAYESACRFLWPRAALPAHNLELCMVIAHIMALTGGHPQCIAYAVTRRKKEGYARPEDFVDRLAGKVTDYTLGIAHRIVEEVPKEIGDVLSYLSVYRWYDSNILRSLMDRDATLFAFPDEHELGDRLKFTFLVSSQRGLLRDDIARRLLAIRLCNDIGPDSFALRCRDARQMYAERLERDSHAPERWALEYLFQFLQEHLYTAHDGRSRRKLGDLFFDEHVPFALNLLIKGKGERLGTELLTEELEKDWEFRFVTNYVLRSQTYTDEPYQQLLDSLPKPTRNWDE